MTERKKGRGRGQKPEGRPQTERKPYPYNVTRNPELLAKLLDGYKWEKATLRTGTKGTLVADVVLTKNGKEEVFKDIFWKDTPEGRRADHEANEVREEKSHRKQYRAGKTERERTNGVIAKHYSNKQTEKGENRQRARDNGAGTGSSSKTGAEGAGLGKGKTKK